MGIDTGTRNAWVIHTSYVEDDTWGEAADVYVAGPHDITSKDEKRLCSGGGIEFKIFDDDGDLCYKGRCGARDFDPLDDYGTPNMGCTRIDYRQPDGSWAIL